MRTYTLYLDSRNGTRGDYDYPNYPVLRNVSYFVNWDNLFEKNNFVNRRCRVRYELTMNVYVANPTNSTFVLSATFGSDAVGTSKTNTNTNNEGVRGTILGMVEMDKMWYNIDPVRVFRWSSGDTLNTDGVSIFTPQGEGNFTVFLNVPSQIATLNDLTSGASYYLLALHFTFEDEDE